MPGCIPGGGGVGRGGWIENLVMILALLSEDIGGLLSCAGYEQYAWLVHIMPSESNQYFKQQLGINTRWIIRRRQIHEMLTYFQLDAVMTQRGSYKDSVR